MIQSSRFSQLVVSPVGPGDPLRAYISTLTFNIFYITEPTQIWHEKYNWHNVKLLIQLVFNPKNILDGSGEGLKDDYACLSKGKFQTF